MGGARRGTQAVGARSLLVGELLLVFLFWGGVWFLYSNPQQYCVECNEASMNLFKKLILQVQAAVL